MKVPFHIVFTLFFAWLLMLSPVKRAVEIGIKHFSVSCCDTHGEPKDSCCNDTQKEKHNSCDHSCCQVAYVSLFTLKTEPLVFEKTVDFIYETRNKFYFKPLHKLNIESEIWHPPKIG